MQPQEELLDNVETYSEQEFIADQKEPCRHNNLHGISIYDGQGRTRTHISLLVLYTADRLPINIGPAVSIKAKNQNLYENPTPN